MGILIIILIFCFAIIVHEFGHLLMAKAFGVKVTEYSVGFGPKLFSKQIGETEYKVCILPLGGYVKMKGMVRLDANMPQEIDSISAVPHNNTDEDAFINKKAWQRFLILIGGVLANAISAFILFFSANLIGYNIGSNVIKPVKNTPAFYAGIKKGDTIIEVNGTKTKNLPEVFAAMKKNLKKSILKIKRKGEVLIISLVPKKKGERTYIVGLLPLKTYHHSKNILESLGSAGKKVILLPLAFGKGVYMLISGEAGIKDMVGPVGIVHLGSVFYDKGAYPFLTYLAIIMMALFFFNILPIPMLDGGHILYLIIEKFRGKSISLKTQSIIQMIVLFLFLVLFVSVTFNDCSRLFTGV